jgi:putative membrane protein
MHGVPIHDARKLRTQVMETIAATDYSRLDQALSDDQSGFSANFLAT